MKKNSCNFNEVRSRRSKNCQRAEHFAWRPMSSMTYEEFQNKFQIHLNQQQSDAVRSTEGPVLLLAVPGSGKTTVLVTRLGYMIYCAGIAPENILTLTYTVAAASDMSGRFCSYFGNELGRRLEFRTINGICNKVLQYYGKRIGKNLFSLAENGEVISRILSDIFRRVEESYATESDLKGIRGMITYIKNMMLNEEEIRRLDDEADFRISEIYKAYNNELRRQNLIDYDDQMIYAHIILSKDPEILQYFQDKYSYICVDEAQDTSRIQHEIIRLLAGRQDNLFMVGDEDQSIYGFRAAYPEALLSFEQDHPGAKILLMEENFRSDAKIVAAADRFIRKNTLRHEKHMTAAREAVTDIHKVVLKDRNEQYDYLVKTAQECQRQTAVLYRNNESVLPLVDQLERKGIPYRLRNAELTFFTHRVVLDIRNIMNFALNPADSELFLQIYYKIATYIRKQDVLHICEMNAKGGRDVLEDAIRYGQLPERTAQSCKLIRSHLKCLLTERVDRAVNRIVYNMGYGDYLERMGMSDSKLFILKAIARNENSLRGFLGRLDELQTIMQEKENRPTAGQAIILSTIHSSKGLEYDTVYLMDIVDGLFPEAVPGNLKDMDIKERAAYEEERRLFYVGVTRAKNSLSVFKLNQKSTFCEELIPKVSKVKARQIPVREKAKKSVGQAYTVQKSMRGIFSQEKFEEYCSSIGEGLIIQHKKLGEGMIAEVQGDKVVIQFEDEQKVFGLKTLYEYNLLSF